MLKSSWPLNLRRCAVRLVAASLMATLTLVLAATASARADAGFGWGADNAGQLGDNALVNNNKEVPVEIHGLRGVTAMAGGNFFSLALLTDGTVAAWGEDKYGELGDGAIANYSKVPVPVSGLSGVVAIAAGAGHSVALLSNGTVMAWGLNEDGQLGDGSTTSSDVPVEVSGLGGVKAIAASANYSLAVLANGTVVVWGETATNQLGEGKSGPETCAFGQPCSRIPVQVSGLSNVAAVAASFSHSIALLSTGTVMAWGMDTYGQLGDGHAPTWGPIAVCAVGTVGPCPTGPYLAGVKAIAGGEFSNLALLSSGTVTAWGANGAGNLGDGNTANSDVPVEVTGLDTAVAVAAGAWQGLAILNDGTVMDWGSNQYGQLGDGNTTSSDVPVEVLGLHGVTVIAGGLLHSLAYSEPPPTVVTKAASSLTQISATLHATVNPNGASVSECRFEYGITTSYGSSVPCTSPPGSGESPVAVSAAITSLSGNTTYHFRIVAANGGGASYGSDETFTTLFSAEFGRCLKVPAENEAGKTVYHGRFTTTTCLVNSATHTGKYEWYPGVVKAGFTTMIKPTTKATLETVKRVKVTCAGESSSGEITGVKAVGNVVVKFTGCASGTRKCTTAGLGEGELETKKLEGELGIERITIKEGKETRHVALDLYPVGKTGAFLEYTCTGSGPTTLSGSILAPVTADKMLATATLKFTATAGKQKPEAFLGGEKDVLTNTLNEQVGLTVGSTQTNEEAVEINAWF